MKPRDIFIKACNEIAIPFIAMGFKPSKNGQCLKKISKDKNFRKTLHYRQIYDIIDIFCNQIWRTL